MMEDVAKRFNEIEEEFYELDKENKKAKMRLEFNKPSDIFVFNAITKKPTFTDDFIDWIKCAFEYAPRKYMIDLDVSFKDMENYDEETLKELFYANTLLEAKRAYKTTISKNRVAIGLVVLGVFLLIALLLVRTLWKSGGVAKEIITYIMDIGATVTFWEALTILIVENKEKRDLNKQYLMRFSSISFHKEKK